MRSLVTLGVIVFSACSSYDRAIATTPGSHGSYRAVEQSRSAIKPLLEVYPGISVAAGVDGKLVWSEGFGFADVEAHSKVTPATVFRLYSTSKSLAAALAMTMAERKQVDLDAPVSRYANDLPATLGALTLRQLLSHRGGVRHYRPGEWMTVSQDRCSTAREALSPFVRDPLVAVPAVATARALASGD